MTNSISKMLESVGHELVPMIGSIEIQDDHDDKKSQPFVGPDSTAPRCTDSSFGRRLISL